MKAEYERIDSKVASLLLAKARESSVTPYTGLLVREVPDQVDDSVPRREDEIFFHELKFL